MHAIDDHQTANARYLTEAGAAILLPQSDLNAESLRDAVQSAMTSLPSMSLAAKAKARLEATQTVADICIAEAAI
jgi:UDP-N-acetylglucosamine--N-acetylmuramyl-(pentapeptide) pyrophosphoryl-undecaprenol N-acetylglucosamine transferase